MERGVLADQVALPAAPVAARIERLCAEIAERTAALGRRVELDWAEVLTVRARLLGLRDRGRISANGTCRLLQAADGRWVAVSLARRDDLDSVEALCHRRPGADRWQVVAEAVAEVPAAQLVERARLLGMPAALLGSVLSGGAAPWQETQMWPQRRPSAGLEGLRVVDLASLWAGPLVAKVLSAAGAHVVKVESAARPDGARATPEFYSWLHQPDQAGVVLDFATGAGRQQLFDLLSHADLVIEASRPRALEQLGCDPKRLAARAGRVWLSITGYGRSSPGRDWVAFGDDAAAAGGLVGWEAREGGTVTPVFLGDAIADPVTGLFGAVAALRAIGWGGGYLVDLAMARAAGHVARCQEP